MDAASGADKEGAAVLAAYYTPGVTTCSGDSELIGNYATTLINTSFWGGEYIHHGHRSNPFDNTDRVNVTLVVAHWGMESQHSYFLQSLRSTRPFRKVVVKAYANINASSDIFNITTVLGRLSTTSNVHLSAT